MKLTKDNYEVYALDYIEGTLPAEELAAFERFLEAHPEIAAELSALRQEMPVLHPDLSVRFEGKSTLKRQPSIRLLIYRVGGIAALLLVSLLLFNRFQDDQATLPSASPAHPLLSEELPAPKTTPQSEAEAVMPLQELPSSSARIVPDPTSPDSSLQPLISHETALAQHLPQAAASEGEMPAPSPSEELPVAEVREAYTREVIELPELVADPLDQTRELSAEALPVAVEETLYASHAVVLDQSGEFVADSPQEEHVYAEQDQPNRKGLLNLLSRKGLRQLASTIITPLSEISPIEVYNDKNERVVEFASIPISRRSNKLEE